MITHKAKSKKETPPNKTNAISSSSSRNSFDGKLAKSSGGALSKTGKDKFIMATRNRAKNDPRIRKSSDVKKTNSGLDEEELFKILGI